jgi:branched-chain amino acid transport system substrate-binding protein
MRAGGGSIGRLAAGVVLAAALAVAGCGGTEASDSGGGETEKGDAVKIGAIHPLTGPLAQDGKAMNEAAKLAVSDINAKGGIKALDGSKLELIAGDSQGKPETGQAEAQKLIEQDAAALVGTYQSAVSTNVATLAARSRVPYVIDVGVADDILQAGQNEYTFRIQPNASKMGEQGAEYLEQLSGQGGEPVRTVAYMYEETDFGTSVHAAFERRAKQLGMKVVESISYDALTAKDLTTELQRVKSSGADVLAVTGYYNDGVLVARNAASVKPDVQAVYGIANGAYDLADFPEDVGKDAEGYLDSNYHFDAKSSEVEDIRSRFKEKTGQDMRTAAVLSYQAVLLIADALERAGDADRTKLRDALRKTSYDKPLLAFGGPIEFDAKGENRNAEPILMQVQDGAVEQVMPQEFQQADPSYPETPWSR